MFGNRNNTGRTLNRNPPVYLGHYFVLKCHKIVVILRSSFKPWGIFSIPRLNTIRIDRLIGSVFFTIVNVDTKNDIIKCTSKDINFLFSSWEGNEINTYFLPWRKLNLEYYTIENNCVSNSQKTVSCFFITWSYFSVAIDFNRCLINLT